jgi:hypothetical protein
MYRVCKGQKVKNVKDGINIRNFYGGDKLPKDYEPPKSYIDQGIVEKIKGGK